MTSALVLPAPPAYHAVVSRASGAEANVVADRIVEVQAELNSSHAVNINRREAERRLRDAVLEADDSTDDHIMITAECAAQVAKAFLRVLPDHVLAPEIDVANSGEIWFEWITGRRSRLVVSFSKVGELNYASIHPSGELKGREYFAGFVPPAIALALSRVLG